MGMMSIDIDPGLTRYGTQSAHRPAHGAVADASDWVAVALVLAQAGAGAVRPVGPRRARVVTQRPPPPRPAPARPGLGVTDPACNENIFSDICRYFWSAVQIFP